MDCIDHLRNRLARSSTTAETDLPSTAWQAIDQIPAAEQPADRIARWLLHPGSLTRLLRENLGDALGLQLLNQGWERPPANEAKLLRIEPQMRCLVRHVRLTAEGQPRVLARVVIPETAMSTAITGLLERENEPLGPLLFADPDIERESLEIALLRPPSSVFDDLEEPAWCRRSLLSAREQRLLIYEAFLPALFNPSMMDPDQ